MDEHTATRYTHDAGVTTTLAEQHQALMLELELVHALAERAIQTIDALTRMALSDESDES